MEDFKAYLPKYLAPEQGANLFSEIKKFPDNIDSRLFSHHLLATQLLYQGDCLNGIIAPQFESKEIKCIILSNTCDISDANKRNSPMFMVLAPIFSLSKFAAVLESTIGKEHTKEYTDSIRKQTISNIFYLPFSGNECFARLDMTFHVPIKTKDYLKNRFNALGDYGFYLFLFKLSIHFCRMRDGVNRNIPQQ